MRRRRIVLDTTYLLPFLGVRVRGLEVSEIAGLRDEGAELLYPELLLPELAATLAKEMRRRGLREPPAPALEGLEALLLETDVQLVRPRLEHLETAMRLRAMGHPDIFDCILYATALHERAELATRDEELIKFLERVGADTGFVTRL